MSELLPCPFCGGEPSLTSGGPGNHYIRCMVCNAATDDTWKAEAIASWNRRAALKPSGDAGELCERLRTDAAYLGLKNGSLPVIGQDCINAADLITTLERQLATAREAVADVLAKIDAKKDRSGSGYYDLSFHDRDLVALRALTPGVSDAE